MHPDMGRFFGPAWQMPIGAADEAGREQIVVIVQAATDNLIHLYPTKKVFRETVNVIPADLSCMYPPREVVDGYAYESFGTTMTMQLLSSLGYVDEDQLAQLRASGEPPIIISSTGCPAFWTPQDTNGSAVRYCAPPGPPTAADRQARCSVFCRAPATQKGDKT